MQLTSRVTRPVLLNLLLLNLPMQPTETTMCLRTSSPAQLTAGRSPSEPPVPVCQWTQTLRFPLSWAPSVKRESREEVGWKRVVKRRNCTKVMKRGSVQTSPGRRTRRQWSGGVLMSHLRLRGWDRAPCHFQAPDRLIVQPREEHLHRYYHSGQRRFAGQQSCTRTLLPPFHLKAWKVSRRPASLESFVWYNEYWHFFNQPSQPLIISF